MPNILIIDDDRENILNIQDALETIRKVNPQNLFPKVEEIDDIGKRIEKGVSNGGKNITKFVKWLREYISRNDIDILILDLALSRNEESSDVPTQGTSGIKIINDLIPDAEEVELQISTINFLPIIVLTGKDANRNDIDAGTRANIVHIIDPGYAEKISQFQAELTGEEFYEILKTEAEKYNWLKRRTRENGEKYNYDLAIICALEKEFRYIENLELDETLNPKGWVPLDDESSDKTYLLAYFKPKRGRPIKVIAVCNKVMGMPEASSITTRVIEKYRPRYVAMTGMAAGLDKSSGDLGDIMIPQTVWNWQQGKFKVKANGTDSIIGFVEQFNGLLEKEEIDSIKEMLSSKDSEKESTVYGSVFDTETRHIDTSKDIGNAINELKNSTPNDDDPNKNFTKDLYINFIPVQEKIRNKLSGKERDECIVPSISNLADFKPAIIRERMISGSAVVADSKIVKQIKEDGESRGVVGLDMEAYGVAYAVWNTPSIYRPKSAIIIKAICDYADDEKNDDYQEFASYASAQTLYKLFTDYAHKINFEDE